MVTCVLFDLGGTLAAYYERNEFSGLRDEGIARAAQLLRRHGGFIPLPAELARRVESEDFEAEDLRVRPLERRLTAVFAGAGQALDSRLLEELCTAFMAPIFARGTLFDDALVILGELRGQGLRLGLVSNTPWGSPATLWRAELDRLRLTGQLDCAVFCRDVGWRKPAAPIFGQACELLRTAPDNCLFVGDHPRWDVAGARQAGMQAVQLCRGVNSPATAAHACLDHTVTIASLSELPELVRGR